MPAPGAEVAPPRGRRCRLPPQTPQKMLRLVGPQCQVELVTENGWEATQGAAGVWERKSGRQKVARSPVLSVSTSCECPCQGGWWRRTPGRSRSPRAGCGLAGRSQWPSPGQLRLVRSGGRRAPEFPVLVPQVRTRGLLALWIEEVTFCFSKEVLLRTAIVCVCVGGWQCSI